MSTPQESEEFIKSPFERMELGRYTQVPFSYQPCDITGCAQSICQCGLGKRKATGSMPLLPALETWVSKGIVPGTLTATDINKNSQGRTRPMCQYPTWTRHDISRRKRGMFDMFVARDLDNDGDMDFVSTRGNSYPYDGVFWLEQVRSKTARQVFTRARREDSEEMPLP